MTRNIREVVPYLADHFVDFEMNDSLYQQNEELVTRNSSRLGTYYKYLGLLHDSWILESNLDDNIFLLKLNDYTTHLFAEILIKEKNLNIVYSELTFPILFTFEIVSLTYNTVNDDGSIIKIDPTPIDEYLYEQIININKEEIEIGLVVWRKNNKQRGNRF